MQKSSSSSMGTIATSRTASDSTDSKWLWFHKGFVEGLKRARSPSASDESFEGLSFELAETHLQLKETQMKLHDNVDALGEVLRTLPNIIEDRTTPSITSDGDTQTLSSARSPSPPRFQTASQTVRTPNESFTLVPHPPTRPLFRIPALSRRPNTRNYIDIARESIPGYYSTSNSEAVHASVDSALVYLFEKAREGDERAMYLIKALCRQAHGTPPEHKTYGQKHILSRWRNPSFLPRRGDRSNIHSISESTSQEILVNPQHNDPPEDWIKYYTRYPKSLPKGVRVDPTTNAPLYGDIVASRLLARLRPNSSQFRAEFNVAMVTLFINRGRFREMVKSRQIQLCDVVAYRPYDPEDRSDSELSELEGVISVLDIAKHYAKCGVSVEEVGRYIEPWVEEYAKVKYEL
ncbi:hypothetical protein J3R30DRAFT_3432880 [Lentinula aciculospora]|uniref:Uncharacterized protein n=1 Tax=Lentinula aciculospora TaxID=153920 RepID=A0A9W9DVJ3_9AGAR|nr:hypothetical protein J3R30DRAFT_3432880 [Lentinula aciculospora]